MLIVSFLDPFFYFYSCNLDYFLPPFSFVKIWQQKLHYLLWKFAVFEVYINPRWRRKRFFFLHIISRHFEFFGLAICIVLILFKLHQNYSISKNEYILFSGCAKIKSWNFLKSTISDDKFFRHLEFSRNKVFHENL
jgi:hypothetical protein